MGHLTIQTGHRRLVVNRFPVFVNRLEMENSLKIARSRPFGCKRGLGEAIRRLPERTFVREGDAGLLSGRLWLA